MANSQHEKLEQVYGTAFLHYFTEASTSRKNKNRVLIREEGFAGYIIKNSKTLYLEFSMTNWCYIVRQFSRLKYLILCPE